MRTYEVLFILSPQVPEEEATTLIGDFKKVGEGTGAKLTNEEPWGRRRLAYQIDRYREGSYHIVVFEAPAEAIGETERTLLITEEVLRHLVTRVERPVKAARPGAEDETADDGGLPSAEDEEDFDDSERIDESETEAAPAAID